LPNGVILSGREDRHHLSGVVFSWASGHKP
jgi:hypothetical protein